jgi:titin
MSLLSILKTLQSNSRRSRSARSRRSLSRQSRPRLEILEDRLALATFLVSSAADSGPGTLRQAILDANAAAGADQITFSIGGGGVQTIAPTSALPAITGAVIIDGTTQPGFAGSPIIELSGASAGSASGLFITAGSSTVRGLVINRFSAQGIILSTGSGNVIEGNYIGTDVSSTLDLGNGHTGVAVQNGSGANRIGTNGDGLADDAEGNVIAGNGVTGVALSGLGTDHNVLAGNFIGTDKTGTLSIPHPGDAVFIGAGARFNRIGTNADGVGDTLERNILARSLSNGIRIDNAHNNVVAGNYVGTSSDGAAALANGTGILIHNGASGNLIGTNGDGIRDDVERNVVSGNTSSGFFISVAGTNNNVVAGNYIGTSANGTAALGNGQFGVVLVNGPRFNRIGTDANGVADEAERNVISGNGRHGVIILNPGTESNVVAGNYVGIDVTGGAGLGNAQSGIMVESAANNTIGGTTAAARNVVSANGLHGIVLFRAGATGNVVIGNYAGTNAAGTAALGNRSAGIGIDGGAHHNRVGTDGDGMNDLAEGNLASGNEDGVILFGAGTDHNLLAGNRIGTDWTGVAPVPNVLHGINFLPGPQANQIGGSPALANTIAFNRDDGVIVVGGTTTKNRIQANSIHSNGHLGIDLNNDLPTLNDALDADAGGNGTQNYPVIISSMPGATTTIFGRFHSKPNTPYTLDFYANAAADPSGFGEGQRYLGAASVTTNANGDVHYFTVVVPGASVAGEVISATATDPDGNTSEFSGNRAPTASAGGTYSVLEGQGVTLDASDSSDPDFDTLTYSWDVNGDGIFGDATGVQPTLSWAQLGTIGVNDGLQAFAVKVQVDDDAGHVVTSLATTLTVINVAPTAGISGPTAGVPGQPRDFVLTASDLSAVDQAAGFTYSIAWGDGGPAHTVPQSPGNGGGAAATHVYAAPGTYQVTVTATDKDGGVSAEVVHSIMIQSILIGDGCCDAMALVIGGTAGDDKVRVVPQGSDGDVKVLINGQDQGTFAASTFTSIAIFGQAGDDDLELAGTIGKPACLYGGAGHDRLKGGAGADRLLGEDGDDLLVGSSGRDLLIGGSGADRLVGNADDDILIAGFTAWDDQAEALCAILDEWSRTDLSYQERVMHLRSGGGLNGAITLNTDPSQGAMTVFDDSAADVLTGSAGIDWFFANLDGDGDSSIAKDKITDLHANELADDIDWILEP